MASYWEHYKYELDMSRYLSLDDPKRLYYRNICNELSKKMNDLKREEGIKL